MRAISRIILGAMVSAGLPTSAGAQSLELQAEFFDNLGGSTEIAIVGEGSSEAYPLRERPQEIVGARFFKEKATDDPFLAIDRGIVAFTSACTGEGGYVVAQDDRRTEYLFQRVAAHLVRPTGQKDQWRARTAICSDPQGSPIAGFLGIVHDNSGVVNDGDVGSRLMGRLFGMKSTTAIYLLRPEAVPSQADIELFAAEDENLRMAASQQLENERRVLEEFRSSLDVGTVTNCGTVIEVRGPVAEIAVPAMRTAPNGVNTFWSQIDRLFPFGTSPCTYGL